MYTQTFPPFSQSVTYFQCIPPLSGSTYVLQSPCFFTVEMCYSLGTLKCVCVLQMTMSFCCECFLFCFAHVLKKHYGGQNICVCVCLLFKLLQKVFLGFILVVHVPAGFFSLLPFLLLFYHCQVFPFSSPFVCSSFKGQFKPPRLHLENFASVFKVWKIYI